MNTPAHLIVGAAAFARPNAWKINLAALLGALAPDISLYVMAGVSLYVLNAPPDVVFDQYYFSPAWQQVFAIDNSFFVWGAVLGLGWWLGRDWLMVFAAAALVHLALDLPFHHDDGRPHFWPLTTWVFESPISYWDRDHHAGVIGPLEALGCLVLCGVLWRRFSGWRSRGLIVAGAGLQLAPVFVWVMVFTG